MKRRKPNKPDVTPLHVQLPADVRKAIVDQAKSGNRTIRGELIETLTRAYGLTKQHSEHELTGAR